MWAGTRNISISAQAAQEPPRVHRRAGKALDTGGRLVALLGRLGEELHHDGGERRRNCRRPFGRRRRLPRDVAVHPFHRVGSAERQNSGEHSIERDAERIEVAAGIDPSVHPPGLLGGHIGQRAGDDLGRFGRLPLARQTRGEDPDVQISCIRFFTREIPMPSHCDSAVKQVPEQLLLT